MWFSLDKNLKMEKFSEGKGYWEFKEGALSKRVLNKREVRAEELHCVFKSALQTKSCLFTHWTSY